MSIVSNIPKQNLFLFSASEFFPTSFFDFLKSIKQTVFLQIRQLRSIFSNREARLPLVYCLEQPRPALFLAEWTRGPSSWRASAERVSGISEDLRCPRCVVMGGKELERTPSDQCLRQHLPLSSSSSDPGADEIGQDILLGQSGEMEGKLFGESEEKEVSASGRDGRLCF